MNGALKAGGVTIGAIGALACLLAGLARVTGAFWLGDFQVMTVFDTGVGLMVAGCLLLLIAKRD
jgi:hypothetical protein